LKIARKEALRISRKDAKTQRQEIGAVRSVWWCNWAEQIENFIADRKSERSSCQERQQTRNADPDRHSRNAWSLWTLGSRPILPLLQSYTHFVTDPQGSAKPPPWAKSRPHRYAKRCGRVSYAFGLPKAPRLQRVIAQRPQLAGRHRFTKIK